MKTNKLNIYKNKINKYLIKNKKIKLELKLRKRNRSNKYLILNKINN